MREFMVCLLLLLGLGVSRPAVADWGLSGAQASCQSESGLFRILPSDESSSDAPGTVYVKPGFRKLPEGRNRLSCTLKNYRLTAIIDVMPPGNGQCEGAGFVGIFSLDINGVELTHGYELLAWSCVDDAPSLVDVQVRALDHGVSITRCYEKDSDSEEQTPQCNSQTVDVGAIAAVNSKIDHDLAAPSVQVAQSATKLPPEQDLSHLVASDPTPHDIPLCAHWGRGYVPTADMGEGDSVVLARRGRIAGTPGDRVRIHAENPQLCARFGGDGCRSNAYVLPGDRVYVGFICSAWSYVSYPSRTNSTPSTTGWVETNRLYAVDPAPGDFIGPHSLQKGKPSRFPRDSLMDAVARGDVIELSKLLGGKNEPGHLISAGCALPFAVEQNDIATVKALLDLGVDPNSTEGTEACLPALYQATAFGVDEKIMGLLIKAGADVKGYGDGGYFPLIGAIESHTFKPYHAIADAAMQRALTQAYDKVRILLDQGVDPNQEGRHGTALQEAVDSNDVEVALLLLQKGADPNASQPLMDALEECARGFDTTLLRSLLEHSADPNAKSPPPQFGEHGYTTPLIQAAAEGLYSPAKLLLEHGADPDLAWDDGTLPAAVAVANHHRRVAALIEEYSSRKARRKP